MDWKKSLDKYLATEPDDGFYDWSNEIVDYKISEAFYNKNEDWIYEFDGQCTKWLNKLFNRGRNTPDAAKIIERAFKLYKL